VRGIRNWKSSGWQHKKKHTHEYCMNFIVEKRMYFKQLWTSSNCNKTVVTLVPIFVSGVLCPIFTVYTITTFRQVDFNCETLFFGAISHEFHSTHWNTRRFHFTNKGVMCDFRVLAVSIVTVYNFKEILSHC